MNIQKITQILIDSGITQNEANIEVKMLSEHFCNYTELDKIRGKKLTKKDLQILEEKVNERASTRTPIQHIIGEAYFMGEYFKVSPNVLIPRDETEILVNKAIEIIKENNYKSVLDIGTGSGCIACIIAKQTAATVLGIDISSDALRIALDNVTKLGINNRAVFRKSNLFEKIRPGENFDIIISNPPYIPYGTELEKELKFEPQEALFAEDNGLYYYKKIIENSINYLNKNGWLIFELGINQAQSVRKLMERDYTNLEIQKDLAGIDRVICGKLKN